MHLVPSVPILLFSPAEWAAKRAAHAPSPKSASSAAATTTVVSTRSVQVFDRTLPSSVMLPVVGPSNSFLQHKKQRQQIMLEYRGHLYPCLFDTGSDITIMDSDLVQELNIPIQPVSGTLHMAVSPNVNTVNRTGVTPIMSMTAFFPMSDIPPKSFSHSFEVAPLQGKNYHFLLGLDLISQFLPEDRFLHFCSDSNDSGFSARTVRVQDSPSWLFSPSLAGADSLMDGIVGTIPSDELPVHLQLSTPPSLAPQYEAERAILAADPDVKLAIEINNNVTGFCNLPESVLKFEVDPEKKTKLFRKQYPIAHTLWSRAEEVLQRWLDTGKIEPAPSGCVYNSPITIAPKRDDAGGMTGIGVCLDTRAINDALISGDKFQLPYIREALENFAGNSIFGELDLQEAYLQFELLPESRPYTAFTWRGKQWMFVGCPFGINLLPSFFQRNMCSIFSDFSSLSRTWTIYLSLLVIGWTIALIFWCCWTVVPRST